MKLSIITINYNNRDGLKKTIESVIHQTWTDYEYIIIDGGSTDGSRELIEQYQSHLSYWCSEPDKGIYNAMNKGVQHAHGEYVNFMNSGDCFYNESVLKEVFEGKEYEEKIISGNAIWANTRELTRIYNPNLLTHLLVNSLNHQGSFIKRQLLVANPYDEKLKIVADWKFWIETIIIQNCKVKILDLIVSIQEPDGRSRNAENHRIERNKVTNELIPPMIFNELIEYIEVRRDNYYQANVYLREHHFQLFRFVRKFVMIIYSFLKRFDRTK